MTVVHSFRITPLNTSSTDLIFYILIKGYEFLFICVIWIQASIGNPYPDVARKTILCPKYLSLSIPVISLPVAILFPACEREMIALIIKK
jgi:hypothetical protein